MPASGPNLLVDITSGVADVSGWMSASADAAKMASGLNAFRSYSLLNSAPLLNAAGNLRGNVVNARWNTVFQWSADAADILGNVALAASLIQNIVQSSGQFEAIYRSNDPWNVKTLKYYSQLNTVAFRTAYGFIPAGTHLVALGLQRACQSGGVAIGKNLLQPMECSARVQAMDVNVSSWFNKLTDGNNIYHFINIAFTVNSAS